MVTLTFGGGIFPRQTHGRSIVTSRIVASTQGRVGRGRSPAGWFGASDLAARDCRRPLRLLGAIASAPWSVGGRALFLAAIVVAGCGREQGKHDASDGEGAPGSLVALTPPHVELGARLISPGEEIVVEWTFECPKGELNNLASTSSCTCTNSRLSANQVKAGERIAMEATLRFAKEGQQHASIRVHDGDRVFAETSVSARIEFLEKLEVVGCRVAEDGSRSSLSLVYLGRSPPAKLELAFDGTGLELAAPELRWSAVTEPSESGRGLWICEVGVHLPISGGRDIRLVIRGGAASVAVYPQTLDLLNRVWESSHGHS